tara:strand:- start:469 stop:681 length:213 start_codon:yes stop_codon:yes gene_type:complete
MYNIYPTIAEYEHTDLGGNSTLFKVKTPDGEVVDVVVDTTASLENFALGGTLEAYNSDVIGHLIYALENK